MADVNKADGKLQSNKVTTQSESATMDQKGEIIHFTSVQKGELNIPTKKKLEKFKVPETDLTTDDNSINITTKLPETSALDLQLSLTPDSLVLLSQNKKVAYYTEIKLPEQVIPQSVIAKFENETLHLNVLKLKDKLAPWDGLTQLGNLNKELEVIKDKHMKFQQQFHTLQLDYQNLLVKGKKEVEDRIDNFKLLVLEKVLKNIDNFELALASANKTKNKDNEQILVGINLILNELRNMIIEEGVNEIPSKGMLLDPHLHEVLDCEETDKLPENTILKVYQKGYKYKDRVLRPSKVKIAIPHKQKQKEKKGKKKK